MVGSVSLVPAGAPTQIVARLNAVIGKAAIGKVQNRSALQLQADATRAALADAGLSMTDIDGVITMPPPTNGNDPSMLLSERAEPTLKRHSLRLSSASGSRPMPPLAILPK